MKFEIQEQKYNNIKEQYETLRTHVINVDSIEEANLFAFEVWKKNENFNQFEDKIIIRCIKEK